MYVITYVNHYGNTVVNNYTTPEPSDLVPLKVYTLDEETGTLTEYVKPERLFNVAVFGTNYPQNSGDKASNYPASAWYWPNVKHAWEVMPNGDYRKLSPEEVEKFCNNA